MSNLDLWNKVCETNPGDTKKVTFGRGFTAICAYSQIKKATEVFGPYGEKWGLISIRHQFIPDTTMVLVSGQFKIPNGEFSVSSSILYKSEPKGDKPAKIDDEFAKKVETDLITKALSRLGFNADVFLGKFDDNRYVQQMKQKFEQVSPEPVDHAKVATASIFFKEMIDKDSVEETHDRVKTGWDKLSSDERVEVNKLLDEVAPGQEHKQKNHRKLYKTILKEHLDFKQNYDQSQY